jgi:hypothetical protein
LADRLAKFASDLPVGVSCAETLQAIQAHRSLLDDPNPADSVLSTVAPALREALASAYEHYQRVMTDERARLAAHPAWASLDESKQEAFLRDAGVVRRPAPITATNAELLLALQHCDLAGWRTQANALSTCFAAALTAALKEAEPKAQRIVLAGATIRNNEELEAWLDAARARLEQALSNGPVIL